MRLLRWIMIGLVAFCAVEAWAHVGSPDVYVHGHAGPYTVLVSVHPPVALPGAAAIEVRTDDPALNGVTVSGEGSASPAETLQRFAQEQKFNGSTWIPAGVRVWKLRIQVTGSRGAGEMLLPVTLPPVPQARTRWLWPVIFGFEGIVLLIGGYIGRKRRNAALKVMATGIKLQRTRAPGLSQALAFVLMGCGVVGLIACAWSVHRARQATLTPAMQIAVHDGVMELKLIRASGGHALNDLVLDHNHVMHLFLIRQPGMDVVLHLHPELVRATRDEAEFRQTLPPMAAGSFALYADIVHGDGVSETATATAGLPMQASGSLHGDDSFGVVARGVGEGCGSTATMMDGYRMTLVCEGDLKAKNGILLRVTLADNTGAAPVDMQNYMGMGGHAAIVARDGAVFAHIHPMGTVMLPRNAADAAMAAMPGMAAAPVVEFPYGFPRAGAYRVFVQMKHGAIVETGAFDLDVN